MWSVLKPEARRHQVFASEGGALVLRGESWFRELEMRFGSTGSAPGALVSLRTTSSEGAIATGRSFLNFNGNSRSMVVSNGRLRNDRERFAESSGFTRSNTARYR